MQNGPNAVRFLALYIEEFSNFWVFFISNSLSTILLKGPITEHQVLHPTLVWFNHFKLYYFSLFKESMNFPTFYNNHGKFHAKKPLHTFLKNIFLINLEYASIHKCLTFYHLIALMRKYVLGGNFTTMEWINSTFVFESSLFLFSFSFLNCSYHLILFTFIITD